MRAGTDRDSVVSIGLLRESLRGLRKFGRPGSKSAPNSQPSAPVPSQSGRLWARSRLARRRIEQPRDFVGPGFGTIPRAAIERLGDQLLPDAPCSEYVAPPRGEIGRAISHSAPCASLAAALKRAACLGFPDGTLVVRVAVRSSYPDREIRENRYQTEMTSRPDRHLT